MLTTALTSTQLADRGWRIPLGLVGLWIPTRLEDSEQFRALTSDSATASVPAVELPICGALSDRWGRRPVFLTASVTMAVLAVPCFLAMGSGALALST